MSMGSSLGSSGPWCKEGGVGGGESEIRFVL